MPRKTINPKHGETLKIDGESSIIIRRRRKRGKGKRLSITIHTPHGTAVRQLPKNRS